MQYFILDNILSIFLEFKKQSCLCKEDWQAQMRFFFVFRAIIRQPNIKSSGTKIFGIDPHDIFIIDNAL